VLRLEGWECPGRLVRSRHVVAPSPLRRRWSPCRASVLLLVLTLGVGALVRTGRAHEEPCAALRRRDEPHAVYDKASHRLCVFSANAIEVSVRGAHGRARGPKEYEGDARTPEGWYRLLPARPSARFEHFLAVSYPNAADRSRAREHGRPPGGAIGVHGPGARLRWLGELVTTADLSDGCIVVDGPSLDRVRAAVTRPLPFVILPEE